MALDFDGTDDLVDHGDINALDSATLATICWWQRPDTAVAADGILGKGTTSFSPMARHNGAAATGIQIYIAAVDSVRASAFTDGQWDHHAIVYDGGGAANADRLKYYRNGVQETLTYNGAIAASLPDNGAVVFQVGGKTDWGGFADMKVAHLKIWNAALSADEVAQEVWRYRPHRTAGLLLWAPYDDGTKAVDYSGSGNNGTVTGALAADGPYVGGGVRPIWS